MTNKTVLVEPAAHMFPSDLKDFESAETSASAFSIAMMNPNENTVPLWTEKQVLSMIEAAPEQGGGFVKLPIETAPKDGTAILVCEGEDIYKAIWHVDDECWQSYCGQPVVYTPQPTHWLSYSIHPQTGQASLKADQQGAGVSEGGGVTNTTPTNQDNEHLDVFTRGETYQPPTHDQKRVDQVKRIMEKQRKKK